MAKKLYYDKRLHKMLTYRRPHGTLTELEWTDEFIMPYDPILYGDKDTMAYAITVPREDGTSPEVLFSAHVDTVHREEGRQKIVIDATREHYKKNDGTPLGADNAAGCWILLCMIDAGVPGTYVFHRGEEQGGIGSKWMATNEAEFLERHKYAVAFDRKACHSVITHQGFCGRCCSDTFANALADALNELDSNFMYVTDDGGVFTDTAEYVDSIGECTNVSVGYYDEHTPKERLYLPHVFALRDACIALDWHALPQKRKPGEIDEEYENRWKSRWGSWNSTIPKPVREGPNLCDMTRSEMEDMAYTDPETFVKMVRAELFLEFDDDDEDDMPVGLPIDEREDLVGDLNKRMYFIDDQNDDPPINPLSIAS